MGKKEEREASGANTVRTRHNLPCFLSKTWTTWHGTRNSKFHVPCSWFLEDHFRFLSSQNAPDQGPRFWRRGAHMHAGCSTSKYVSWCDSSWLIKNQYIILSTITSYHKAAVVKIRTTEVTNNNNKEAGESRCDVKKKNKFWRKNRVKWGKKKNSAPLHICVQYKVNEILRSIYFVCVCVAGCIYIILRVCGSLMKSQKSKNRRWGSGFQVNLDWRTRDTAVSWNWFRYWTTADWL